jgi:UDP-N-acetylglucosamine 2-epimerase (non-hydrolysing)
MIHIFLGTKAQLVKMAPIMQRLQRRNIAYNFIFSGQHQATIKDIREEFNIKEPDCILYKGPDITGIGQMFIWSIRIVFYTLKNRKAVWQNDKKGIVLNHGDTFSTLLGTLTAKICGLKSGHVESGLRSFNLFNPFPEEITRRITFNFSDVFFAPGDWALENIKQYKGKNINTINNTLLDSLKSSELAINDSTVEIPNYQYGIVSIHRFENIFSKEKLLEIIELLEQIAVSNRLLIILHKPTLKKLHQFRLYNRLEENRHIELRPRYSYFQFIKLVKKAHFVVTDGGSNQEECHYLGKPCLILRKATERPEGIDFNACLSAYEPVRVEYFISHIDEFSKPEKLDEQSPSEIIIDALMDSGLAG